MADTSARDDGMQACEFFIIRLAPDPVRHEHVNIGVALFQTRGGFAGVRCNHDFRRAHCLFPQWTEADLSGLEEDLAAKLRPGATAERDYFLQLGAETFSHGLQISAPRVVLTADPKRELELLFDRYAASPAAMERLQPARSPRQVLLNELERIFAGEGIAHRLQRNLRAGEWLGEPDEFAFDFHYQPNGAHHVLQALPLQSGERIIKEFCFTVARLRGRLAGFDAAAVTTDRIEPPDLPGIEPQRQRDGYHRQLLGQAGARILAFAEAPVEALRIRRAMEGRSS